MKQISLFLCFILFTVNLFSQEVRKIHQKNFFINEVYYVLKEDKSIKHGKYLKYREISKDLKLPLEYGSFDNNKKAGVWLIFNESLYQNPVRIIAEYDNDQKSGKWVYFYTPDKSDGKSINVNGNRRLSNVKPPKNDNDDFNITVDTSGIKTAAVGSFLNNKKTGIWCYYLKNGILAKKYDFSLNKSVYSSVHDITDSNLNAGIQYFYSVLSGTIADKIMIRNYYDPLTFKFEILVCDNNMSVKNISNNSSDSAWDLIEKSILSMNRNWIDFDPSLENISITIDLELQHDQFSHQVHFEPKTSTSDIK